jgi:hypothetical protein
MPVEHIRDMPACRHIRVVVTSTNANHVRALAGDAVTVYEIIGKPYDLGVVVRAVEAALGSSRPLRPTAGV